MGSANPNGLQRRRWATGTQGDKCQNPFLLRWPPPARHSPSHQWSPRSLALLARHLGPDGVFTASMRNVLQRLFCDGQASSPESPKPPSASVEAYQLCWPPSRRRRRRGSRMKGRLDSSAPILQPGRCASHSQAGFLGLSLTVVAAGLALAESALQIWKLPYHSQRMYASMHVGHLTMS